MKNKIYRESNSSANIDSHHERGKDQMSVQDIVMVARQIKSQLRKRFPSIPFSVRSSRTTFPHRITIEWFNYPAVEHVQELIESFAKSQGSEETNLNVGNHQIVYKHKWSEDWEREIDRLIPEHIHPGDPLYPDYFQRMAKIVNIRRIHREKKKLTADTVN